ncbi:hypothetical protein DUNSADRAFT_5875 [Dunaliella salina]|uniref:Polyketide synthase dehydratase domain-containing protein n=1 Tax=Dunaliella salina TaxID=3046 RepID=A0ABQ7GPF7_DUNSA|nr:hypothetical protein DUNSADRAFT_5875 [Dunaliella salina]|eukprot:KAF5836489.1 hypothetical protein DUNSADRAFT_5875 [Dunaliella salina]
MLPDAFKLREDGSAVDPRNFREALQADDAKMAALASDKEVHDIVMGEDLQRFQNLLRSIYKTEKEKQDRRVQRMSERTIDAQRASAVVPRDTVQLYEQLRASGLEYGPAFRLLRNVHVPAVKA